MVPRIEWMRSNFSEWEYTKASRVRVQMMTGMNGMMISNTSVKKSDVTDHFASCSSDNSLHVKGKAVWLRWSTALKIYPNRTKQSRKQLSTSCTFECEKNWVASARLGTRHQSERRRARRYPLKKQGQRVGEIILNFVRTGRTAWPFLQGPGYR